MTDMSGMFIDVSSFNQSLDSWEVRNVKAMNFMLHGASSFDHATDSWHLAPGASNFGMFN